jgi:PDDEXK-like domain of unknown function (DUF3799)
VIRHPKDGRVHWSELKEITRSAAHYKLACEEAKTPTQPIIIGAVTDSIVFGNRGYAIYPDREDEKTGKMVKAVRNGERWEKFRLENEGKILCIPTEYEVARGAAEAVLANPIARELLEGCEFQKVLQWSMLGLDCAAGIAGERGGLDANNPRGCRKTKGRPYIVDLKVTSCTEPDEFERHCWRMKWHGQGAYYKNGAHESNIEAEEYILIAVEGSRPHNVTCFRVTERSLEMGDQLVSTCAERLRACDAEDFFPGYVQELVDCDVPEWEAI